MARAPKTLNPKAQFVKDISHIWLNMYKSVHYPIAMLATWRSQSAISDSVARIGDTMGVPNAEFSNKTGFLQTINDGMENVEYDTGRATDNLKVKKGKGKWVFTINNPETSQFSFFSIMGNMPGVADLPGTTSREQKVRPLFDALTGLGVKIPTDAYTKNGKYLVDVDYYSGDKGEGIDTDNGERLSSFTDMYANHVTDLPTQSSIYTAKLQMEIIVEGDDLDVDVVLKPKIELTIDDSLVETLASTPDTSAVPYLSIIWMKNAVQSGVANKVNMQDTKPIVDMRTTSKLLGEVQRKHGKAKPRVNGNGFTISRNGLPLMVPVMDNSNSFMQAFTSATTDEDGNYQFEENYAQWSNKILMVDWFNDFLLYTSSNGNIQMHRMLGYVPLDASSEYLLMNTPVSDRLFVQPLKSLIGVINALITPDEANKYLLAEARKEDRLDGGKVTQAFGQLLTLFQSRPLYNALETTDPEFKHDSDRSPLLKHMFGIELEELNGSPEVIDEALHINAYLKAMAEKRKDIDMPVIDRLQGMEYFLIMANTAANTFPKIREAAIKNREALKSGPPLENLDIPNVDAGGNLKGFMPHQVRIHSDMQRGGGAELLDVSPGGGKTLMLLADILVKKLKNPSWKPLIVTKPGLVKNFASEINFFTKGKVNVVIFRMGMLKSMKRKLKMDTAEKMFKWVKSLPNNTIFITAYTDFSNKSNLYPDLDMPSRILGEDVGLPQFLHIIRLVGFEQVSCDESHLIKNMNSLRSQYTYSALAQAELKTEASGTVVLNTASDLLGQAYGINPLTFGNSVDGFKARYNLSGGIIKDDETASLIKNRMRRSTRISEATKEDWAFVLPDLKDTLLYTELTDKQTEFYNILLKEAELEMKLRMSGKTVEGDESDDDEEKEEFEDEDDKIIAMANASLAKVEQFVVAPDENEQYRSWEKQPTGDDLISPLVKLADTQFDRIYADQNADHSNNKTAVFGIHKVASGHFMRHSRWARRALHYRAGNLEVIRRFKTDPQVWILVADGTSLREGENLQLLSYIMDMQAPWSPGDHEQLVSRMFRPDPKGQYNKDEVNHIWLIANRPNDPGIGGIKLARMISKSISSARLKYEGDSRWSKISKEFEDLGLLSMSLELIFQSKFEDLQDYLQAWSKFVSWETSLNKDTRMREAKRLEEENPGLRLIDHATGRVLDRNQFTKLTMRTVHSTTQIQGSKKAYVPWVKGATPPDPLDLGLEVLGGQDVEVGDYIMTEFGPGIVLKASMKTISIEVYGMKKISLLRARVSTPSDEGKVKLRAIVNSATAWRDQAIGPFEVLDTVKLSDSLAPKAVKEMLTKTDTKAGEVKTKPTPVKEEPLEEDAVIIEEIFTDLINGMPALVVYDAPDSIYDLGWQKVEPYVRINFRNWDTADKFLDLLNKKFNISPSRKQALEDDMEAYRDGKAMKLTKVPPAKVRNFFLSDHRKLGKSKDGRQMVNPYWIGDFHDVYLAFSEKSHPPSVTTWLKRVASKSTSMKTPKFEEGFAVNIFSTLNEAAQDIRKLGNYYDIPASKLREELRELREDIRQLKKKRSRPTSGK